MTQHERHFGKSRSKKLLKVEPVIDILTVSPVDVLDDLLNNMENTNTAPIGSKPVQCFIAENITCEQCFGYTEYLIPVQPVEQNKWAVVLGSNERIRTGHEIHDPNCKAYKPFPAEPQQITDKYRK